MAELFARHEINRASRWPLLSRVLVGSLVLHLFFGLMMKYVPVARGIFGVASNAYGIEFGDGDYERTIVRDEVTLLSFPGGKFQYPEGFFAGNPGETAPPAPMIIQPYTPPVIPLPKFTPIAQSTPPKPAQLPTPAPLPPAPKIAKEPKAGDIKLPPLPAPGDGKIAKTQPTPAPTVAPTPDNTAKDAANKELDRIAAEKNVVRPRKDKMLMKPFDDLWNRLNATQAQQPLNWDGNVEVELVGERSPENTLQNLTRVSVKGEPSLAQLLTEFVAAGGDSGALLFLQGPTQFHFNLKLEGPKFTARVEAKADSPEAATELARTYGAMMFAAKIAKKGDDEEIYFNNANIKADGANLVITMTLKRDETKNLVNKQMASAATKAQQKPTQTPMK